MVREVQRTEEAAKREVDARNELMAEMDRQLVGGRPIGN